LHKNTWKQRERDIASFFGTKRTPLSGGNSGHGTTSDTLSEDLYVELKSRKRFSVVTLWDDTAKKAKKENKVPIVALSELNRPGFFLLIHSSDLEDVYHARRRGQLDD